MEEWTLWWFTNDNFCHIHWLMVCISKRMTIFGRLMTYWLFPRNDDFCQIHWLMGCILKRMATSPRLMIYGLFPKNGDFCQNDWLMGFILSNDNLCLWFDWWRLLPEWLNDGCYLKKWRLLPMFWWMATTANGWLTVFVLRNGDLCLCFDWWRLLLVFWWMTFC